MRRKKRVFRIFGTIIAIMFALLFIYPTVVTLADSFMSSTEINAHYGKVFSGNEDRNWWDVPQKDTTYKNDKVFIKIKPNRITFSQYADVLFKSPEYLFKFWNSVKLTLPILVFQILVALGASYSFARFSGRLLYPAGRIFRRSLKWLCIPPEILPVPPTPLPCHFHSFRP